VKDYKVPPFSLHISGGGGGGGGGVGDDVVKVPTLYPGEYSIQAGLVLHPIYIPEEVTQLDHKISVENGILWG